MVVSHLKNLLEYCDEVGYREFRLEKRMLAQTNDADVGRFGEIAADDAPGRFGLAVAAI